RAAAHQATPPTAPSKPAAPAYLRPPASPTAPSETGASPVLSSEEVQRKLEEANAQAVSKEWTPPPVTPVPERPKRPIDAPSTSIDWESAPAIFDQMVSGIRKDRVSHEREMIDQNTKIESDWQHVIQTMR